MKLLTLRQAAERLSCSYEFLYRQYRRGAVPVTKIGRFIRISEDDLVLWLNAHRLAADIISATKTAREQRTQRERNAGLIPAEDLQEEN